MLLSIHFLLSPFFSDIIICIILNVIWIIMNTATAISLSLSLFHPCYFSCHHVLARTRIIPGKGLHTCSVVCTYTMSFLFLYNNSDILEISVHLFKPFQASRKLVVPRLRFVWDTFVNQPCSLPKLSPKVRGHAPSCDFRLVCKTARARPNRYSLYGYEHTQK